MVRKWLRAVSNCNVPIFIRWVVIIRLLLYILLYHLLLFFFPLLIMGVNTSNEKSISIVFKVFHLRLIYISWRALRIVFSLQMRRIFPINGIWCWGTFVFIIKYRKIVDVNTKFLVILLYLILILSVIHICLVFAFFLN